MRTVDAIFDFLYNKENFYYKENQNLHPVHVKIFTNMVDIDSLEINDELERFVVIVRKKQKIFCPIYYIENNF